MTVELIGAIMGLVFIVPTIYFIRTKRLDDRAWPIFLICLPVFYMLFGVLAMDGSAILKEFLYGLPYIATGLLIWRVRTVTTALLIGLAWLSHGFYDYYHDFFFINPGVFSWYPAFCALIDISVGIYLLLYYSRLVNSQEAH